MTRDQLVTMLEQLALDVRSVVGGCRLIERCLVDSYATELVIAARVLEGRLAILLERCRGDANA